MNLVLKYYSDPKIQTEIMKFVKNREVVGSLKEGSFFSRPDILAYPNDLLERVKRGAAAFHCSVEHWSQPMHLSADLSQKELNNIRTGFDVILDIDAKSKLEHTQIAAKVVMDFLKDLGLGSTIKFSGNRGFHIAISGNAFPEKIDFKETRVKYPEIPQAIASYIREEVKDYLMDELISYEGGVAALVKTVESISELSPYSFIDIEKNWGSRHLFRMPYSLHHKTWLVSVPIKDPMKFKRDDAQVKNVKPLPFLVNKDNEGSELILRSLDFHAKIKPEPTKIRRKIIFTEPVPEMKFPPCIKTILAGINDGKKRSLFTLATFLRAMNWDNPQIEKRLIQWNNELSKPLSERAVRTQLKWHFRQSRNLMPANCDSDLFYRSLGICKPTDKCRKNPVNYVIRLTKKLKSVKTK